MNKQRLFTRMLLLFMAAGLVTGCSKEVPEPGASERVAISLRAALPQGVEARPQGAQSAPSVRPQGAGPQQGVAPASTQQGVVPASTRSAVDPAQPVTLHFLRCDESAPGVYGPYGSSAVAAVRSGGAAAQAVAFSPAEYYLAPAGAKTKMVGWYPGGATAAGDLSGKGFYDATAQTVGWTFDGSQDILTAPVQEGSALAAMPAFAFAHRLSQLRFFVYAETQGTADQWGKILKIEVTGQQNQALYSLSNEATGAVSFSGAASAVFSAGVASGGVAPGVALFANRETGAVQAGGSVMIAPQSAATYKLILNVETAKKGAKSIEITRKFDAGYSHRIYLRLTQLEVTVDPVIDIGDWVSGGSHEVEIQ